MAERPAVVELRIHGIGGSDATTLLGGSPSHSIPRMADANNESGFWERDARSADGSVLQGYLWGQRGPWTLGLWLVLLPFTLVNVAGWSVASGARTPAGGFETFRRSLGAKIARRTTAALGLALTAGWTLWMVAFVAQDLVFKRDEHRAILVVRLLAAVVAVGCLEKVRQITVQSRGHPAQLRQRRVWLLAALAAGIVWVPALVELGFSVPLNWLRALSLVAAAAASAVPFALAGSNRQQFEQYRPRLGGTGVALERRRLRDEETLASPCFYDHPTESAGLLFLHGIVAVAILGIVTARVYFRGSPAPNSLQPLLGAESGTSFLGRALLCLGLVQCVLIACLIVAGAMGTSPWRAGHDDSKFALVINALRPASLAGIGVFLFTACVGSIDALGAVLHGDDVGLASFPQLELVPAFLLGASASILIVFVCWVLSVCANKPSGEVAGHLTGVWRRRRALRSLVANTDYVVVLLGVVIGCTLLATAIGHRHGELTLVPMSASALEYRAFGFLWVVGVMTLSLPSIVRFVASRCDGFKRAVSGLWDLLSFWPRRFHPLGVPPEAERTVPEVQSHLLQTLEEPEKRVQIVAHSQGSVIAFAALVGLRDPRVLQRVGLVTLGSPLFALYPRLFPAQVSPDLIDELRFCLPRQWVNLWRPSDPFCVEPGPDQGGVVRLSHMIRFRSGHGESAKLLGHRAYFEATDTRVHAWLQRLVLRAKHVEAFTPMKSFAPRRQMVSWLDPRLLALTAYEAGVSAVFGKWADARRVGALERSAERLKIGPADGRSDAVVWIDFVADAGDAFDPTFAVASALAHRRLDVDVDEVDVTLERGDVLVLGGDEVYPTASRLRYENQLVGPYALASRCVPTDEPPHHPTLLAIPGNHDWYDGLRSFHELFQAGTEIGNWTCSQTRSYWAASLVVNGMRTRWWLWGVDLQLDNALDRHQLDYFIKVSLKPGDRVILCSAIPMWAHAADNPTAFDVLREFVEDIVVEKKARVVLHLSGDSHHYARYVRDGPSGEAVSYVTAGGGGAFTHPTHHLHETIELPVAYESEQPMLSLRGEEGELLCHPSRSLSRWSLVARNLGPRFYLQNKGFLGLLAGVAAIASYATIYGDREAGKRLVSPSMRRVAHLFLSTNVSIGVALLMLLGWAAFARPRPDGSPVVARAVGLLHGIVQVLALVFALWRATLVTVWLHDAVAESTKRLFAVESIRPWLVRAAERTALVSTSAVIGAAAGMVVLSLYLVLANLLLGMHDNEAASAVASTKYKHFLRLRIDTQTDTAEAWVLHVPNVERVAAPFRLHDPRPRVLQGDDTQPPVTCWDHFEF
jgi:hypothetical protein